MMKMVSDVQLIFFSEIVYLTDGEEDVEATHTSLGLEIFFACNII